MFIATGCERVERSWRILTAWGENRRLKPTINCKPSAGGRRFLHAMQLAAADRQRLFDEDMFAGGELDHHRRVHIVPCRDEDAMMLLSARIVR